MPMEHPPIWPDRAVGSVMPIPLEQLGCADAASIWTGWVGDRSATAFRTARAALAALLLQRGATRMLLPSYVCASLVEAARAARCEVEFFAVRDQLAIDTDDLRARLRTGDAVLAIDYFGRAPDRNFRALVASTPEVLWIEDRAQALDPGEAPWGDVVLYSPRKLIGVADGGLLVGDGPLPAPDPSEPADTARLWFPQLARAEDPTASAPQVWFAASQAREAAYVADRLAMSHLSGAVLRGLSMDAQVEARRRNHSILLTYLNAYRLLTGAPQERFAPMALPLVINDCTSVAKSLSEQRIFCARHWMNLPSPPAEFPESHDIARRCLSIPCDPHYSADEMHRIGKAVLETIDRAT